MNKAIEQTIMLKDTTAAELFDIFLNPEKHAQLHGGTETIISRKEGARFSLMNGHLRGKNLMIVPNKMIVQAWRGDVWNDGDIDSVLTLVFSNTVDGAQIDMVHACTPTQFTELWDTVYWQPIRAYVQKAGNSTQTHN